MTKKNAPSRTGTSAQGATKKSFSTKKIITSILISQMLAMPVLADEPEIIVIDVVPPVVTEAPQMPIQPLQSYEWDQDVIDYIAAIYWAETGANGAVASTEKLMITQLIYNRSQYGSPFPSDLLSVCRQRGEFNKGRVSDRNRLQAEANLNKVKSQADGWYQGIPAEMAKALYMGRVNGVLTFYDSNWSCVYEVTK